MTHHSSRPQKHPGTHAETRGDTHLDRPREDA